MSTERTILASQIFNNLMHRVSTHLTAIPGRHSFLFNSRSWTEKTIKTMDQHQLTGFRDTITISYRHFKNPNNIDKLMRRFRIELLKRLTNMSWLDTIEDQDVLADLITQRICENISANANEWVSGMATGVNHSGSNSSIHLPRDDTVLIYGFCGNIRYDCTYPYYPLIRSISQRHYRLIVDLDIIGFRFNRETMTITSSSGQRSFVVDGYV